MAVSLAGLARAFGRIATADPGTHEAQHRPRDPHPPGATSVAPGATSPRSSAAPTGLVAKDGAEAVYAVGLADGRGVALKVADGGQRARPVVLAAVLRRLGVESAAYPLLEDAPVLGHGEPVGAVVAVGVAEGPGA